MRMQLSLDSPILPEGTVYDTQPIYEFDLEQCFEDGYVNDSNGFLNKILAGSDDKISVCRLDISGAGLNRYFSTNMPHRPWDDGDVLQSRISPYVLQNDNYIPNPNYYNFDTISTTDDPVADAPDDWGTASNYFTDQYNSITVSGVSYSYKRYINVRAKGNTPPTWASGSHNYFKDVDRNAIKSYYTANDYSFGVYRCSSDSGSSGGPIMVAVGCDSSEITTTPQAGRGRGIMFTTPTGGMCSYHLENSMEHEPHGYGGSSTLKSLQYNTYNASATNKLAYLQGTNPGEAASNCVLCFVHFTYNDPDPDHYQYDTNYYGVALITHNSLAENNVPIRIQMYGISGGFWGASIIGGGGGESHWGPIPNPEVPDGSFTTNTTNVGDRDGQHILDEVERRRLRTFGIFSSGVYSIYEVATYSDYTKLAKIEKELFNSDFIGRFQQSFYDPLSAVLAMHIIPTDFCVSGDWGQTEYDVVVAGYNVSDNWYIHAGSTGIKPTCKKLQHIHPYHIGSIDLGKMYDGYPDFNPYTKAILHLPFIGECELNINEIAHGVLGVTYTCDLLTGNIVAIVWGSDYDGNCQNIKVVNGNCAYSLPLYAKTMDGSSVGKIVSGAVSSIVSGAVGLATANPLGIMGVASGLMNVHSGIADASRTSTQIKGDLGGSAMLLTPYDCWLEVIHPKWVNSMYYDKLNGIPSSMSNRIADNGQQESGGEPVDSGEPYTGYLQVQSIELDSVNCTESERSEIEKLLMSGVYVRGDELQ